MPAAVTLLTVSTALSMVLQKQRGPHTLLVLTKADELTPQAAVPKVLHRVLRCVDKTSFASAGGALSWHMPVVYPALDTACDGVQPLCLAAGNPDADQELLELSGCYAAISRSQATGAVDTKSLAEARADEMDKFQELIDSQHSISIPQHAKQAMLALHLGADNLAASIDASFSKFVSRWQHAARAMLHDALGAAKTELHAQGRPASELQDGHEVMRAITDKVSLVHMMVCSRTGRALL